MGKDLRIFLLAVGIPALAIACAGIYLIRCEIKLEAVRQEQFEKELRQREQEWRKQRGEWQQHRRAADGERRNTPRANPGRKGPPPEHSGEAGGPPPAPRRRRFFSPDVFSPESSVARERILWIGDCMLGLLFLSFGAGGWLLVRSARAAREEALKKTDFLSNISHEFKTPLTTICLCAELAQDEGLSPERRRKAMGSIVSEANRLKELVLNALDFSRLEKQRRAFSVGPCDLGALIDEAAEPLRERFAAHGLVLPESTPVAQADASAFKQILVILLDNAAKYAAANGPVEVACTATEKRVAVSVSDRGPGLAREGLRHAFDRFWRGDDATTAETGGSGLGLAIAKGLARGMHGDLSVAARPGGGLVFTLALARTKPTEKEAES